MSDITLVIADKFPFSDRYLNGSIVFLLTNHISAFIEKESSFVFDLSRRLIHRIDPLQTVVDSVFVIRVGGEAFFFYNPVFELLRIGMEVIWSHCLSISAPNPCT